MSLEWAASPVRVIHHSLFGPPDLLSKCRHCSSARALELECLEFVRITRPTISIVLLCFGISLVPLGISLEFCRLHEVQLRIFKDVFQYYHIVWDACFGEFLCFSTDI